MNWAAFSALVPYAQYSSSVAVSGRIGTVLGDGGTSTKVPFAANAWYPFGRKHNDMFNGFRYVDMDHSYQGASPVILGEGSNCVIVILVHATSPEKFAAHISATSPNETLSWKMMKTHLHTFWTKAGQDLTHVRMYVFSERLYRGEAGSFEQANLMDLLSGVFEDQLNTLAERTSLIEGEKGVAWNAYSSVRVDFHNNAPRLQVVHARQRVKD